MRFAQWVAIYGPTYLTGLGWTAFIALWASVGAIVWGSTLLLIRLTGRPPDPSPIGYQNLAVLVSMYRLSRIFCFTLVPDEA